MSCGVTGLMVLCCVRGWMMFNLNMYVTSAEVLMTRSLRCLSTPVRKVDLLRSLSRGFIVRSARTDSASVGLILRQIVGVASPGQLVCMQHVRASRAMSRPRHSLCSPRT